MPDDTEALKAWVRDEIAAAKRDVYMRVAIWGGTGVFFLALWLVG